MTMMMAEYRAGGPLICPSMCLQGLPSVNP